MLCFAQQAAATPEPSHKIVSGTLRWVAAFGTVVIVCGQQLGPNLEGAVCSCKVQPADEPLVHTILLHENAAPGIKLCVEMLFRHCSQGLCYISAVQPSRAMLPTDTTLAVCDNDRGQMLGAMPSIAYWCELSALV